MRVAKRSTLYERRGDNKRCLSLDAHRETPYARREEINSLWASWWHKRCLSLDAHRETPYARREEINSLRDNLSMSIAVSQQINTLCASRRDQLVKRSSLCERRAVITDQLSMSVAERSTISKIISLWASRCFESYFEVFLIFFFFVVQHRCLTWLIFRGFIWIVGLFCRI